MTFACMCKPLSARSTAKTLWRCSFLRGELHAYLSAYKPSYSLSCAAAVQTSLYTQLQSPDPADRAKLTVPSGSRTADGAI